MCESCLDRIGARDSLGRVFRRRNSLVDCYARLVQDLLRNFVQRQIFGSVCCAFVDIDILAASGFQNGEVAGLRDEGNRALDILDRFNFNGT